jgi:hypothetical protein
MLYHVHSHVMLREGHVMLDGIPWVWTFPRIVMVHECGGSNPIMMAATLRQLATLARNGP